MQQKSDVRLKGLSPYSAAFTREQFLFYEMRTTARLVCEGLAGEDVVDRVAMENLFQYPTERSVRKMAHCCVRRLAALGDESLVRELAVQPAEVAKQICLYAMMKQYRVVWDFMITVVGEKQVLVRVLVENSYLDSVRADHLNSVLLSALLENAIRSNNDDVALPAFNCFS